MLHDINCNEGKARYGLRNELPKSGHFADGVKLLLLSGVIHLISLRNMRSFIWRLLGLTLLLILPFVVLIRLAVYFHTAYSFAPWLSIVAGVSGTFLLLLVYLAYFRGRRRKTRSGQGMHRTTLVAVVLLGYCGYALLYISGRNVKSPDVASEFTSLHPVLRLGLSTILLLDQDLVLTDANRTKEDYRRMGLPGKRYSLHYPQSNGYVHAMDIRTRGRSGIRNFLMTVYFRLMGFNVLRHVGTDDHLHVSLMSHDRPGSI